MRNRAESEGAAMSGQGVRMAAVAVLSFTAGALAISPFVRAQAGRDGERVFELRVYHTLPGRLPALHGNFRDFNVRFLKKHGIESVGYWTPQDAPAAGDTLIFMVAHESREAATRHWKEFREDAEWQKLAKAAEASGPIVEKAESTFLAATDYSPLK